MNNTLNYELVNLNEYQSKIIKEHLKDPKYKTEMCKNYIKYGKCSYRGKCRYAHGEHELICKNLTNKNYKKISCEKFGKGYCPYGNRCQYKHTLNFTDYFYFQYIMSSMFSIKKRLSAFQEINLEKDIDKKENESDASSNSTEIFSETSFEIELQNFTENLLEL